MFAVILYAKSMDSGIRVIDKPNDSVTTVCIDAFHNTTLAHTCYKFMKVLFTEFLWHVKF